MRKFSISDKLILASLLLSTITIIIVASYSFYNTRNAILDRTFSQLNSVRAVKTNLLENFFRNRLDEVQLIKSSSDISNIVNIINHLPKNQHYKNIVDSSLQFNNPFISEISSNHYKNVVIVGRNKNIYQLKSQNLNWVDTSLDFDSLWSSSVSNNFAVITDLTKPDSLTEPNITISSKISDSLNNTLGIIIFELSHSSIDSIMLENDPASWFGTSGESYLVGRDLLMRSSSRFQSNSILSTVVKTDAVDMAFKGNSGTLLIDDYRGVSVLSSFGKINVTNLDWVILAEMDFEEATIRIYKIRNEIVFISIFIFFLVLLVVFILSRRITYPIQRLNHAAREIGKGNFDVKIKHHLNDEIGDLTDTFNNMIQKLKDQSEELEIERVKSLNSLFDGQETERQRLSRELHDSLGQLLIALKLKYENCLNKIQSNKLNDSSFYDLGLLFDRTIDETRRISNNLMPAGLSEFGLTTAVRNICNEISETAQINVIYNAKGNAKYLSLKEKMYIFRITQEALTNILKHSYAKNASIEFVFKDNEIELKIIDDGIGFDKSRIDLTNSNGLNNIKDRVSLLSGTFSIDSTISKGTMISINIPLENK